MHEPKSKHGSIHPVYMSMSPKRGIHTRGLVLWGHTHECIGVHRDSTGMVLLIPSEAGPVANRNLFDQ